MHEKEHVIKILEETKDALLNNDVFKLKELSNQTVHAASTEQDTDSITLAIIIYSLSKVIERKYKYEKSCTGFCRYSMKAIERAIDSLKKGQEEKFRRNLQEIIDSINKFSGDFKANVEDVFRKARINKASKIYEHGISMEQTAKLLGITMYELAGYVGQQGAQNPLAKTISAKERIKIAVDFFR
ncbi:hypothetical protein HY449_00820 [Candidatus Pacearchaeota archaeon]|nr:hypothetical protein [Candidatus Pacearchaeota archaeon]